MRRHTEQLVCSCELYLHGLTALKHKHCCCTLLFNVADAHTLTGPSLCGYKGGRVASRVSSLDVSLVWCTAPGLDDFMTAAEKEKLYTAIGYSDSSHNLALPKQVRSPATF